ncbi:T9SS type A sorting domain-containing protein [Hymenobacter busanensis]|uniref:T9SS type A sorting domain-containing protein n=1 Tax=Hymenobacter busanensis TaxID=2607656 RepID=A0A7L4ZZE2_9BACT|nr:T9SS type A sorting domain-containing protein [Hymenobacter busanensis]KAA9333109.1 T9SS type A sorting domain-containing protein [Hymenobacter busanensis]QHJ08216.1 T9SS type A sorting domain-containing protein [Hymenobacter busanensis]
MTRTFTSPTRSRSKWHTRLLTLASALLLAPAVMAQITVPAGNPNTAGARRPLGTWYGFERSALIYTPSEIGSSGNITQIGFYLNSVSAPGAAPTKIYLKTVSNATFAAATTVAAEETGATLVYDATIPATSFVANSWVTVPLTTPFAYNGTSNLEVIVETNATGAGNETSTGKVFRSNVTGTNQAQYWNDDTTPSTTTGTLSTTRPNIQLTGLAAITCPAATGLVASNVTTTSAQIAFTPGAGNTTYTVTYFPTATPANTTTVTPAPTASPITLSGLTLNTAYTVNIVANCAGTPSTQVSSVSFTTPAITNDNPSGAIVLPLGATCTPVNGTNTAATTTTANGYTNPGLAGCGIAASPKDVWYQFTTAASGSAGSTGVTITVTGAPAGYLRLFSSTNGAAGPFTEVACAAGTTNNTVSAPLTVTTLTPNTTYFVSVAGYGSADTQGAFTICATALAPAPANDAAVASVYTLGKVSPLASPVTVQAVIRNAGSAAITNRVVTLDVTGATTFTNQQLIASLAPGASTTVTFAAFPVTATTGTNTVTVTLPADGGAANNTASVTQAVTTSQLSYLDASQPVTASVGVSATTPNGILAVKYTVAQPTNVSQVSLNFLANPTTTSTYQVVILNATATGTPGTVVYSSPTQNRPTAAGVVTIPITGSVTVNGPFYVGLREISGNVGIGYQVEDPLRAATFYYQVGGTTTWNEVGTTTLRTRLGIDVSLLAVSATRNTELANAIAAYPNPASGSFTLNLPALKGERSANLTLLNTLGQQVQVRTLPLEAAGTQTQVDVSTLAAGVYTLRVQAGTQVATKQIVVQ